MLWPLIFDAGFFFSFEEKWCGVIKLAMRAFVLVGQKTSE